MPFYQPTFNTLELIKDKAAVYVFGWKSKGVYSYKLLTIILQGAFLPNIEYFGSKIGIQSNYTPVIVDQKN